MSKASSPVNNKHRHFRGDVSWARTAIPERANTNDKHTEKRLNLTSHRRRANRNGTERSFCPVLGKLNHRDGVQRPRHLGEG